jgi:hypothetical protein
LGNRQINEINVVEEQRSRSGIASSSRIASDTLLARHRGIIQFPEHLSRSFLGDFQALWWQTMVDDTMENEHGTFRGLGELGTTEARTPCPKITLARSGGVRRSRWRSKRGVFAPQCRWRESRWGSDAACITCDTQMPEDTPRRCWAGNFRKREKRCNTVLVIRRRGRAFVRSGVILFLFLVDFNQRQTLEGRGALFCD